jgi:hypothetical protein
MRGTSIETIFVSHTGWYSTFETSLPACLDLSETMSLSFGCLQLARARRDGMRAGADHCKLICRKYERGHVVICS